MPAFSYAIRLRSVHKVGGLCAADARLHMFARLQDDLHTARRSRTVGTHTRSEPAQCSSSVLTS